MSSLIEKIHLLKRQAEDELTVLQSEKEAQDLKVKYLGKKGLLTEVLKGLGQVDASLRAEVGQEANAFKVFFEEAVIGAMRLAQQNEIRRALEQEKIDVTLPSRKIPLGHAHPISQVLAEIRRFFLSFGFEVHSGPEIEEDFYNFKALAIPDDHPARDMQDTFYLASSSSQIENSRFSNPAKLLRTHTSPVQIHVMESRREKNSAIRMIAPGAVYRRDSDLTHTPMFHQIEGLVVDQGLSFADLKGVLKQFLQFFFGGHLSVRFRPSYFPFTEPSAEVDIACVQCAGNGCRICKQTGWLEVMGCGMVDPDVFSAVGYDAEVVTGFAFGMGIERLAMLKFGVDDLRSFFENDVRFLRQF